VEDDLQSVQQLGEDRQMGKSVPGDGMYRRGSASSGCIVGSRTPRLEWRSWWSKKNAIGRSRGGLTTKIHLVANRDKKPIRFELTPGNQHDITMFDTMIDGFNPDAVVADKGYDSKHVVESLTAKGVDPVIPHRECSKPRELNTDLYQIRYMVECCFFDLKRFRRVATRYEKTARNFAAFLNLACVMLWL
jgi:transposase